MKQIESTFEEALFQLSSVRLAGKWWNKGKGPLMIALHGWMDNANSFDELAKAYGPDQQLLALDLAGHGHSSHSQRYNLWDYAADISELLEFQLDIPAHIIGHSLGGIVALFLPHFVPKHCTQITLIDSLGPLTEEADRWLNRLGKFWDSTKRQINKKKKSGARYSKFDEAVSARAKSRINPLDPHRAKTLMSRNLIQVLDGWDLRFDQLLNQPTATRLTEAHAIELVKPLHLPIHVFIAEDGMGKLDYKNRLQAFHNPKVTKLKGDHHLHMLPDHAKTIAEGSRS